MPVYGQEINRQCSRCVPAALAVCGELLVQVDTGRVPLLDQSPGQSESDTYVS